MKNTSLIIVPGKAENKTGKFHLDNVILGKPSEQEVQKAQDTINYSRYPYCLHSLELNSLIKFTPLEDTAVPKSSLEDLTVDSSHR